jgi:hypothetical protein
MPYLFFSRRFWTLSLHATLLSIALSGLSFASHAQRPGGPPQGPGSERMEALRIAYITEELALTPEESEVFWPLQRAFDANMLESREALQSIQQRGLSESMPEGEVAKLLEEMTTIRKAMVDDEAAHLLAIIELLGAERGFKMTTIQREMARKIRENLGSSQGMSPRPGNRQRGPRQGL